MVGERALMFIFMIIIASKFSIGYDLVTELKDFKKKSHEDCYAYADVNQLQLLYDIQEEGRKLWPLGHPFIPCNEKRPLMYNATANAYYCKRLTRPIMIDAENLDQLFLGLKVDTSFRSSHNREWCIKVFTWMTPSYLEHTYGLKSRRRRRDDHELPGLKRVKQNFHNHWANPADHCPAINNFVDGQMLCQPINDTLMIKSSERDVINMTRNEIDKLKSEIFEMVNHERIVNHYRLFCDIFSFFYGHRSYISCVRNHLHLKGINLPIWNPSSGQVPLKLQAVKHSPFACLASIYCHDGWLDIAYPSDIQFNVTLPINVRPENICSNTLQELHTTLIIYHHQIHALVGGVFSSFDAPATILFYFYHNWLDKEVLRRWENCSPHNMNMRKELIQSMGL